MRRRPIIFIFSGLALAAGVSAVHAHAVLEKAEAPPNASYRAVVKIGHGCAGSATTKITVTIPEGVLSAKPMPKAGWRVTTVKGDYAREYQTFHGVTRSGVKEITWSDGLLPDDWYDEFIFSAHISDAFKPGAVLYFPVVQECQQGAHHWIEIPRPGQDDSQRKEPAPALRIIAPVHTPTDHGVDSAH